MVNPVEIIARKRDGNALTEAEMDAFISGYTNGHIPDYQMAAMLMAVYQRGMSTTETVTLTRLMRDSGARLDLSAFQSPKVDKHSTGGVGDKVSLVLSPLVASCGIINPMISGRSLGHTGGTLDKLEAIPGFNSRISLDQLYPLLQQNGAALIGQTAEICPADKKIYALRDATATVPSIPLICGSILSKKLAEDLDALVLDIKCGSGAISPDASFMEKVAASLVSIASQFGVKTVALITQMDQPLGKNIGTWLETVEAVEMLQGRYEQDFYDVTMALSAQVLVLGGKASTIEDAVGILQQKLESGQAFSLFCDMIAAQGGDCTYITQPSRYGHPEHTASLYAEKAGFVHQVHARTLGDISRLLGAGRLQKDDEIDYSAGLTLTKKVGDFVEVGEKIATLYSGRKSIQPEFIEQSRAAFTIKPNAHKPLPSILKIVDQAGIRRWETDQNFQNH